MFNHPTKNRVLMNVSRVLIASLLGICSLAIAETNAHHEVKISDPEHDTDGNTKQKIQHRLSPEIYTQNPFSNHQNTALLAKAPAPGSIAAATSPISYHGGPVMGYLSKVVIIWYGNWNQTNGTDTASGKQIIRDAIWGMAQQNLVNNYSGITNGFSSNLGLYTQTGITFVTQASSSVITEFTQAASTKYGNKSMSDANVFALVKAYAGAGDPNAIYLVLSSSDIAERSGFLSQYCGWHSFGSIGSNKVKYGFIGNPNKSLASCAVQAISPNGNAAVDGMVSVIAHELVETVTDPLLNAWYNSAGSENSDMCSWTFGSQVQRASNGAYWNVTLPTPNGGSRNYLLQRQLSAKDSKCYINATGPVQ
jgi:Phosphate-induced protein 1 conserved region